MFDKLKKAFGGLAKDIGNVVSDRADNSTSNQVYEAVRDDRYEYFAVIRYAASTYRGRLVDLPEDRGAVEDCKTSTEVLEKLTELLNAEFELCKKLNRPFPTKTPYEKVKEKYNPNIYKIERIYPKQI